MLDETGGLLLGGVDPLLPQPPLAQRGQVPDEREGGVSDVSPDVLQQSSSRWKTSLQRLPDKTGQGNVVQSLICQ